MNNNMEKLIVKLVKDLKTSKGDDYKKVDVQKQDGSVVEGVSAFKFKYPNQAELVEGAEITAMIVIDGNYRNLVSATEKPSKGNFGAFKAQQIEKTMERKESSIGKFQDNKEFSIRVASTMSGAVQLAIAEYKDKTVLDTLDQAVLKWRKFLWNNWEVDPKDLDPLNDNMY